jgi:thiamine biosynthesis lipoprotein
MHVHRARPAMGTLFEVVLVGEHDDLEAIAEAALDEITRVERLLSRFDPRSEISRINREAYEGDVVVDFELAELFTQIDQAWRETSGAFDITSGSGTGITWADVKWNAVNRTLRFHRPEVKLDCGGLGKGYALDCAQASLKDYGITRFFMHGGTSSALARGLNQADEPWRVTLPMGEIVLNDAALSCSATSHQGKASDILQPASGGAVVDETSVVVTGPSGLQTEFYSTALVCLGRERGKSLAERCQQAGYQVIWKDS